MALYQKWFIWVNLKIIGINQIYEHQPTRSGKFHVRGRLNQQTSIVVKNYITGLHFLKFETFLLKFHYASLIIFNSSPVCIWRVARYYPVEPGDQMAFRILQNFINTQNKHSLTMWLNNLSTADQAKQTSSTAVHLFQGHNLVSLIESSDPMKEQLSVEPVLLNNSCRLEYDA